MNDDARRDAGTGERPAERGDPGPDPRPAGPGQVDGGEIPDGTGLRIGAVGDLHFDGTHRELIEAVAREAEEEADILVVPGDLTTHGEPGQARIIAEVFGHLTLPVVMVLGNHDYEAGRPGEVREILEGEGITVLDGEAAEIQGVGFAGVKGFPGGFGRGALGAFGEPLIKSFVQEAVDEAFKLENALRTLGTTIKVVVVHYAPVTDTLAGEPEVIFPFLGSSRLLPPIESLDVDVVFHGHAHTGTIEGSSPGGVPVYNVSHPLLMATEGKHLLVWEARPLGDVAREEPVGAAAREGVSPSPRP